MHLDSAAPLALNEGMFEIILELMDIAQEVLPKQMGRSQTCLVAMGGMLKWMESRGRKCKVQINWMLVTWHLKAALAWREHASELIDQLFVDGAYTLHEAPCEDFAVRKKVNVDQRWLTVARLGNI